MSCSSRRPGRPSSQSLKVDTPSSILPLKGEEERHRLMLKATQALRRQPHTHPSSVTYVPGLKCYLCSRLHTDRRMRGRFTRTPQNGSNAYVGRSRLSRKRPPHPPSAPSPPAKNRVGRRALDETAWREVTRCRRPNLACEKCGLVADQSSPAAARFQCGTDTLVCAPAGAAA